VFVATEPFVAAVEVGTGVGGGGGGGGGGVGCRACLFQAELASFRVMVIRL
jgi:hypothetical protein